MLAGLSFIDVGEHEHCDSEVEGAVSEVCAVPEKAPAVQEKVWLLLMMRVMFVAEKGVFYGLLGLGRTMPWCYKVAGHSSVKWVV